MTACLLFLGSFVFYLVTLTGTVPVYRDSGDLINAIYTLGVAHPPGYPVYVMTGKVFTCLVPFGNVAYRVSAFSALCASGAVAGIFLLVRRSVSSGVAAGAALLFAVTPAVLSLARVSEMYTFAALFAVGIIAAYQAGTPRSFILGSFLMGLGFGVHPILLFLAPLFFSIKPREALPRLGFFLVGFSVVLMLMLRAQQYPVQNWGNPSSWIDLWNLITRRNYGGLKLHPGESHFVWTLIGVFQQVAYFAHTWMEQWGWVGVLGGGIGVFAGWRHASPKGVWMRVLACWLLAGPLFFLLSNLPLKDPTTPAILEPYLVLVNVFWALWVAVGLNELVKYGQTAIVHYLVLAGLLVFPLVRASASFQSHRSHFYAYDLGRNLFRTLPERAVLYDPDDPVSFTLRHLQLAEHRREDVVLLNFFRTFWGYKQLIEKHPDFLPPAPVRSAQELEKLFWTGAIDRRPFYVELPVKIPQPLTYKVEGLVYRIEKTPQPHTLVDLKRAESFFPFYSWRGVWRTTQHTDFFTRQILNYRASAHCNLGMQYAEQRDWKNARRCYLLALAIDPMLTAAYNNLGVAEYEQGRYDRAAQNYRWALRYDPQNQGYQRNLELAESRIPRE